ncbi:hypothetical protein QAD02_010087 [Eretmocerus hayati]|uniref:Uncharacterized protein n=1 Tax=Eretmocerus hayati TaxID=131215 RepID=A0ACC2NB25_9HYME|nr:hypothetical protein QAD02_010087 [Eretmocerus hayati]
MRFNKQELMTLATQPSQKFEKEGILYVKERQEGFFRRTEISLERWCRLRGNLLFYFKSREQWSEPLGVIILEQFSVRVEQPTNQIPYGFSIVFDGGVYQQLGANSSDERDSWLQSLQLASYDCMRSQLLSLRQRMEATSGHKHDTDIHMLRLKRGITTDPAEIPICEVSLSCDNLLCDGHGRPPNPVLEIDVQTRLTETSWVRYARTEVVERSSNPGFLTTVSFRASDGIGPECRLKITAYDVREKVSQTATPIGSAVMNFSAVQDTPRLRIPLKSAKATTVGFLTINVWNLEAEDKGSSTESTPSRNVPSTSNQIYCHRRSHSLPPRLGTKIKLPHQGQLKLLFANPHIQTYRFHSGLGGDICVHETMAESRLCFQFPQQLLGLWIQEEKELLQEVAGMGELREPWHSKQVELLDRHLHLLHLYSQAKENLAAFKGSHFKQSSRKNDRSLEFAPINLHLQRMWVHNDTLNKCGLYDSMTVGAFTAHSHKSKNGGLLRLVQALKESPAKSNQLYQGASKISMAHDAIQAIKQLRRDVVDAMRALMKLAKEKQTNGMLPICEEMVTKTRILLSLWDPGLVEEALTFLEEHKVAKVQDEINDDSMTLNFKVNQSLSPFKRITQQLNFDLKSPDFDEFVTPDTPECVQDIWAKESAKNNFSNFAARNGTSASSEKQQMDNNFVIFPEVEDDPKDPSPTEPIDKKNCTNGDSKVHVSEDEEKAEFDRCTDQDLGKRFLDTQKMCNSPSANYYKPTDEPEPWDLTQLNIEASVMCLVSKVKFLCGRCGSPAVRLRNKNGMGQGKNSVVHQRSSSTPVVMSYSRNGLKNDEVCKFVDSQQNLNKQNGTLNKIEQGPAVIHCNMSSDKMCQAMDSIPRVIKTSSNQRNKFTEGLDFASIVDWTSELRPSMKKLRQAMDGLLKTARLTHSVFRVQEDAKAAQRVCNVRYRRDVCFSQALTALVSGLMAKFWCQRPDAMFLLILTTLGPIVSFEALLSYYGDEIDMWGDMAVAVEDLLTVTFTLSRCGIQTTRVDGKSKQKATQFPLPRVTGSRTALTVLLPVPDAIYSLLPLTPTSKQTLSFNVTPVFFNIGINEMASLAESLGTTKPQEKSNMDNFERLNEYYLRFKKLNLPSEPVCARFGTRSALNQNLTDMMANLKASVQAKVNKNVEVLQLSSQICRRMRGLRFTSCKSAKDRTGMSITLEQVNILASEYHLAEHEFARALDCMRSEGCRRENTLKNIGVRKYAFNSLQIMTFPKQYRPPTGTYGSAQS